MMSAGDVRYFYLKFYHKRALEALKLGLSLMNSGSIISCDRLYLSLGPGGAGGEASHAFGHYWFHIRGVSFIQGLGFNIEV